MQSGFRHMFTHEGTRMQEGETAKQKKAAEGEDIQ